MASKTKEAKPIAASDRKRPATKASAKPVAVKAKVIVEPKEKRIRGSFSMPISDYTLIAELKSRSKTSGRTVKKNELLRAGLHALSSMSNDSLQSVLTSLAPVASKRSGKSKKST